MKMSGEYDALIKHVWFSFLALSVRVVGCHAVNPFIYGILDKKLLRFWKFCHQKNNSLL
jgi:hypothetical protein